MRQIHNAHTSESWALR